MVGYIYVEKHTRRRFMDITVGPDDGIQGALDRVSESGGGTVTLLPGTYLMHDALRPGSGTSLVGSGEETILRKADGWEAPLWEDGDWGYDWATCDPPPPWRVGDGVQLSSDKDGGWNSTVATIVEIDGNRARVSRHFEGNHMVHDNARISKTHSIIDLDHVENVSLSDFVVEGNRKKNFRLDGCRGGAIHGLFANSVTVRHVTVRDLNGDAISYQRSDDWLIENCVTEGNAGHGLHPGSGAIRPVMRNCISRANGRCGIFVCWRVRHGVFEDNVFEGNGECGISIGHKDTDNLFRKNRIVGNDGPGIQFRGEKAPMCPDRCTFEENVIEGNHEGGAQVVVMGEVRDLVFRGNTYDSGSPRFEIGADARDIATEED
jgi:hypothetical protein